MLRRSKMKGASVWMMMFMLMVLVSVVTLVMRLGPHYLDHRAVVSVLEGITEAEATGSKRALREIIDRRLTINSVRTVDVDEALDIKSSREGVTITIEYEVREELVGNISAVLSFHDQRAF